MSDEVQKFNPNHGPDGRFSSGPHTSSEDFKPGSVAPADVNAFFSDPGSAYSAIKSDTGVSISNSLNINTETGSKYVYAVDGFRRGMRSFPMSSISFQKLEGDTLAQCRFGWTKNDDGSSQSDSIMIFDPTKTQAIKNMWTQDQKDIKAGKIPWGAISYAKNEVELLTATVLHEYAHGCLSDYTLKRPKSEWIDPNDPMSGTQEFKTIVHEAAQEGWQPPSQYAKQEYAEMFAECTVVAAMKGTTGNRKVDVYVDKVTKK